MNSSNVFKTSFISIIAVLALLAYAGMAHAAGPWYVDPAGNDANTCLASGAATACQTIQAAVNKASAGDTINVAAGTYVEDLSIPGTLTGLDLSGAGAGSSILVGVTTVPAASFPLAGPNIDILGAGTKLHGFTIDSPAYVSGNYSSGLLVGAMNVEIYDNAFETNTVDDTGDISQAIITYAESAIPGVDVSGLSIHDNTFSGLGSNSWGYEGIYVNPSGSTGDVTIEDNTFTGNIFRAITSERSDTSITGNSILTDVVPTDGSLSTPGSYQGINVRNLGNDPQDSVTVIDNTVGGSAGTFGFWQGIRIGHSASQTLTDFNITHNTISGNTTGIKVSSADGVVVNRNAITGNTAGAENTDSAELNATCNWWGNADGPSGNGPGTGDTVSVNADFEPWLTTSDLVDGPCDGPLPVPPTTVKVVVNKFIDGAQATSGNANSSSFPMISTTTASNVNGGVETGGNAYTLDVSDAYHATTTDMASGASYATEEVMSGAVVGASCSAGKPFALIGYSSGDTLALAQGAATSTTAPNFTGLTSDKYVIVWNKPCLPAPVNVYPADGVTLTTAAWDKADWTDVTDPFPPIVYFYESSNSSATSTDGSFVTPAYQSGALSVSEIPTPGTPAGTWYWHARAQDADGNLSPWSAATRVIVDNTPPLPAPPANACATPGTAPAGYTLQNGTTGNNTVTLAPNTMFVGHGGNDKVTAPDGNYIICTGSGNDTITIGHSDYTINAGGGNNTVTTGNGAGSITTGNGNDTITTGNGAHTINAGGGNNTVTTGNGDQVVTTGSGNDKVTTGNGAHTINAGGGNNTVTTGNGDQVVTTGAGNDKITTGSGNDTISAGGGNNTVKSWAGNDTITTGGGNDSIDAGADTDSCSAGGGINTVVNCSP